MQQFGCILLYLIALQYVDCSSNDESKSEKANLSHSHEVSTDKLHLPMLELMSLSLDSWGAVHSTRKSTSEDAERQSHTDRSPLQLAFMETPKQPILSLIGTSLDKWGLKSGNGTIKPIDLIMSNEFDQGVNPLAQVLRAEASLFDPHGYETHSVNLLLHRHTSQMIDFGLLVLVVLILSCVSIYLCFECSPDDDDSNSPSTEVPQSRFIAVESCSGSWAQIYQEAQGDQKEALELLFRCDIISTKEFVFSNVSQEHMQECIWIATHMLRQKPLEEWVALWCEAQQTFEDNVTACFEARGGPHSPFSAGVMHSPMPDLRAVRLSSRLNTHAEEDEEQEDADPYTDRGHWQSYSAQDPVLRGAHLPDSQTSQNTAETERSRYSIERSYEAMTPPGVHDAMTPPRNPQ